MIFFSNKSIKIDKELYVQLSEAAEAGGYSSTEELILHVLKREVAGGDDEEEQKRAEEQLRGLGYLE